MCTFLTFASGVLQCVLHTNTRGEKIIAPALPLHPIPVQKMALPGHSVDSTEALGCMQCMVWKNARVRANGSLGFFRYAHMYTT